MNPILAFLLTSCLAGYQGDSERTSTLSFTRPKGWERKDDARTGAVTLLPPDLPAGRLCSATIVPAQEFPGTPEAWHESLWKLVSQGTTPLEAPAQGKRGKFLLTVGGLAKPDGTKGWIALYTVLEGKRAQAVLFLADREDLFGANLEAIHGMVAGAALLAAPAGGAPGPSPAPKSVGDLGLESPQGWNRQENATEHVTTLIPPGLPAGRECAVLVLPVQAYPGTDQAYHGEIVRRASSACRIDGVVEVARIGKFQRSTFVQVTAQGSSQWVSVYTAHWEGRGGSVIFAADRQELFKAHAADVAAMIRKVAVPPGAPLGLGTEYCPRPLPPKERDVAIQGAWLSTELETRFQGGRLRSEYAFKILLLFANGVAAKVDGRNPGGSLTYQAEGFATMDVSDPQTLKGTGYGTWKEDSGQITVKINFVDSPQTFRRDGDNLKSGDHLWGRIKSLDGARLDGTFRYKTEFGQPWSIAFRKDGTFSSIEVNNTMGGTTVNPEFPSQGSGTYEVRKWSLILRYEGGFVQSLNLKLESDDPQGGKFVELNGYVLERVTGK